MNKTLAIVIIILLLFIVFLLGGYLFLTLDDTKKIEEAPQEMTNIKTPNIKTLEEGKEEEKIEKMGPLYSLDQFTLNLRSDKNMVYLKIKIALELSIPELKNELDAKNAVIRDAVIEVVSSKTLEMLSDDVGKERAMDEIIDKINSILHDGYIKNAYITEFVIV